VTAGKKIVIDDYDDFRRLEGRQIVESDPIEITAQGIQDFCRGTLNDEWIHWDRERCQASPLGDLISAIRHPQSTVYHPAS